MEGMQYLQHRVIDGTYQAVLRWKIEAGIVYIMASNGWQPTDVPIKFVKDFELDKFMLPKPGYER